MTDGIYSIIVSNLGLFLSSSAVTFGLGWLMSQFFMTKKERADIAQKKFENVKDLISTQHEKCSIFEESVRNYVNKAGSPTFDDFYDMISSGEAYFCQQKIVANAVLSGVVDVKSRDTLVQSLVDTVQKSLPAYYKSLKTISERNGFNFNGELKRENYESIYIVVEKYSRCGVDVGAAGDGALDLADRTVGGPADVAVALKHNT